MIPFQKKSPLPTGLFYLSLLSGSALADKQGHDYDTSESDGEIDIKVVVVPLATLRFEDDDIDLASAANNSNAKIGLCMFSNTGDYSIDVETDNDFKLSAGGADNISYKLTIGQGSGSAEFDSDSDQSVIASNEGIDNHSTSCDGSSYPGAVTATITEDGTVKLPGNYTDTATITMVTI